VIGLVNNRKKQGSFDMKILLIEDQPAYSIGLIAILRSFFNLKNIACESCLDKGIEQINDSTKSIDVVFMSVNHYSNELIEYFNTDTPLVEQPPIIILSSLSESQQQELLTLPNISAVISKNTHQEDMLNQIKSILIKNGFNPSPNGQSNNQLATDNPFIQSSKRKTRQARSLPTPTKTSSSLEDTYFDFNVSADEEHTVLTVKHHQQTFNFSERVHHYLLLILARQRQKDVEQGFDDESQGWVEISELQKMLGLDYCHLNIQIFRARKQINTKMSSNEGLVEVLQRRVGGIRFTGRNCNINRAGKLESTYQINKDLLVEYSTALDSVA
jgi:DNA-binding NarL/FixJ family response regulator